MVDMRFAVGRRSDATPVHPFCHISLDMKFNTGTSAHTHTHDFISTCTVAAVAMPIVVLCRNHYVDVHKAEQCLTKVLEYHIYPRTCIRRLSFQRQ